MAYTTKLDAVNEILSVLSESRIDTLSGPPYATDDVQEAVAILDSVDRAEQLRGWSWNVLVDQTIQPDGSGKITLPTTGGTLPAKVWIKKEDSMGKRYTLKHEANVARIWDPEKDTFVLNRTLRLSYVRLADAWTEAPETYRHYIKIKAARVMQARHQGTAEFHRYSLEDEIEAKAMTALDQMSEQDVSIFDSVDVQRFGLWREYPDMGSPAV